MILALFKERKELRFERTYDAPIDEVWDAWTRAERLREWWGPEKTTDEETASIEYTNELTLTDDGSATVDLLVTISAIGPKAKMAAFGMKWGYKQQLDHLGHVVGSRA